MLHRRRTNPNPQPLAGNVITSPYAMGDASFTGSATSSVSSDVALAPDGTVTGDLCIPDGTSTFTHHISQLSLTTSAAAWVLRVRAKPGGYSNIELLIGSTAAYANFLGITFNLRNGNICTQRSLTYTGYGRCRPLDHGWFLCEAYLLNTVANSTHRADVGLADTINPTDSWSGDTVAGINLWGFEFAPVPN